MNELSATLKTLRENKQISMDQMCEDLKKKFGVSIAKSTISKWENGKAEPSLANARVLANYFNVTLDCIIGLEDIKESDLRKDDDIERIERAREKMDTKDKEKMMQVLELAFEEFFKD